MNQFRLPAAVLASVTVALVATGCGGSGTPDVPKNVSPAVGAVIPQGEEQTFVWRPVDGAGSYDFHLFNREDGDIERIARDGLSPADVCDADECRITVSVDLPAIEDHAWRVRAARADPEDRDDISEWSRSTFTVAPSG